MKKLRKMITKYDLRQKDYEETLKRVRPEQRRAFRRPGSRKHK